MGESGGCGGCGGGFGGCGGGLIFFGAMCAYGACRSSTSRARERERERDAAERARRAREMARNPTSRIKVPHGAQPGSSFEIVLAGFTMSLCVPAGKRGGDVMSFRIPEQVAAAATCSVQIPAGAAPKSKFNVVVNGSTLQLTVPPHLKAGQTLKFMLAPEVKRAAPAAASSTEWACDACTYRNPGLAPICAMCSARRPEVRGGGDAKAGSGVGAAPAARRAEPPIAEAVHETRPMLSADVVVPAGLRPGGAFNIDTGGGKLMRVVVPAGVSGGQTIRVQYPAPERDDLVVVDGVMIS